MPGEFPYDGFLSHAAKEKPVVREAAERHGGLSSGKTGGSRYIGHIRS